MWFLLYAVDLVLDRRRRRRPLARLALPTDPTSDELAAWAEKLARRKGVRDAK
jgi:hypothetical protein